jgi:hypothetical protein
MGTEWAEIGGLRGVPGGNSNRLAAHVGERVAAVPWHGHLADDTCWQPLLHRMPDMSRGSPRRSSEFAGPSGSVSLGFGRRTINSQMAAGLGRNRVSDGRNPAGCRPGRSYTDRAGFGAVSLSLGGQAQAEPGRSLAS